MQITTVTDTFYKSFVNTLIFNIATIAAIVVGIVSYTYRAARVWYANGGREFLMSAAANITLMCNKLTERVYYTLEDAELA
jgi:hypothetical protein